MLRPPCFALGLWLLLSSGAAAQSTGYWHLPCTVPQFCGFGCGPGHHAPMIRTHGCHPPRQARRVHTRDCPQGGLAYAPDFGGLCGDQGCHAQLDALTMPTFPSAPPEPTAPTPQAPPEYSVQRMPSEPLEETPEPSDTTLLPAPDMPTPPLN